MSEEACLARHERSEMEERRKFMSYLKQPAGVTRGRRRVDHINLMDVNRADQSSGANTPDQPMSPAPFDAATSGGSKTAAADDTESLMEAGGGPGDGVVGDATTAADSSSSFTASSIKERRRTASLTKKEIGWKLSSSIGDDNSAMSWDVDEVRWPSVFTYHYVRIYLNGVSTLPTADP